MTENSFPKTDSEMTDANKVGMSNCELDIQSEKSSKVYFKKIMEYSNAPVWYIVHDLKSIG